MLLIELFTALKVFSAIMNETVSPPEQKLPRWLHGWALVTVVAVLPLATLGAEVTTKKVGMADTVALRSPWYLFTLSPAELWDQGVGLVIEHGHRTAAWFVGMCGIVLCYGFWKRAHGTSLQWIGAIALALISVQGLLGIFRVQLNALVGPQMALIHGCFAQIVIAFLASVVVVSSSAWSRPRPDVEPAVRQLALLVSGLTFVQIAFGATIRHFGDALGQRLHLVLAFVLVIAVLNLVRALQASEDVALRRWAILLPMLIGLQIVLGVEAWLRRFGSGVPADLVQSSTVLDVVRTGHFLVGTAMCSSAVVVNLLLLRPRPQPLLAAPGLLEGALRQPVSTLGVSL